MWEKRYIGPKNDEGKDASRAHLLKYQANYWPKNEKVKKFLSGGSMVRAHTRALPTPSSPNPIPYT